MIVCLITITLSSIVFSDFIKKHSIYIYVLSAILSLMVTYHAILFLNGYSIEYVGGIKQIMKAVDSGALGGSIFILVMYMGALNPKNSFYRNLRMIRAELSIIGGIVTIPHNIHYLFQYILNAASIFKTRDISLWINLMMFSSAVFAIGIMLPLFVTSFRIIRKKMSAKKWKNLQEFAYIFYAMLFIQVMMVYLAKPSGAIRNISMAVYIAIFVSYTILKIQMVLSKRKVATKVAMPANGR